MKKIFSLALLATILMLASCAKKQEAMLSPEEQREQDSLALKVAVMPVMDCLPIYYAQRTGILDEMGLNAKLLPYNAQMDVDTALINGTVQLAYSDLIRAVRLIPQTQNLHAIMQTQGRYSMIAQKSKRVSKMNQMKERMVAISRLCVTDYWCDAMLDSTSRLKNEDIYRPQINNVQLRAQMMRTNLMDAAILPEPYAQWMIQLGNKRLYHSSQTAPLFGAWLICGKLDKRQQSQIEQFIHAYDLAVENLNSGKQIDSVRVILRDTYGIPQEIADSLDIPHFEHATLPAPADLSTACEFLRKRDRMPKGVNTDSLIQTRYIQTGK